MIIFVVDIDGLTSPQNIPDSFCGPANQVTSGFTSLGLLGSSPERSTHVPEEGSVLAAFNELVASFGSWDKFSSFKALTEDLSGSNAKSTPAPKQELTLGELQRFIRDFGPESSEDDIPRSLDLLAEIVRDIRKTVSTSHRDRQWDLEVELGYLLLTAATLAEGLGIDLNTVVTREKEDLATQWGQRS